MDKKELQPLLEAPPAYVAVQPAFTRPMALAPRSNGQPVGLDGQRSYAHGLCACCETPGSACLALFCPCVAYGRNRSRFDALRQTGLRTYPDDSPPSADELAATDAPTNVGVSCALYALAPQVLGLGQVLLQCFSRTQLRERYEIRGNPVQDLLISAFCAPCALVQEAREIEEEEQAIRARVQEVGVVSYRDDQTA